MGPTSGYLLAWGAVFVSLGGFGLLQNGPTPSPVPSWGGCDCAGEQRRIIELEFELGWWRSLVWQLLCALGALVGSVLILLGIFFECSCCALRLWRRLGSPRRQDRAYLEAEVARVRAWCGGNTGQSGGQYGELVVSR